MTKPTAMDWLLLTMTLAMRAISLWLIVVFVSGMVQSGSATFGEMALLAVLAMNDACDWIRDKMKLKGLVE